MGGPALELLPYALIATLSPLGFAATLVVIGSGRVKALAFAVAFVAGQLLACALLVLVGSAAVPHRGRDHPTFRALLELAFGAALLGLAALVRRRRTDPGGRAPATFDRLRRLRVVTALAAGLLLGIGGPKRLVLTSLAAASIAASSAEGADAAALAGGYTAVATLLVWAPVLAFELAGDRALTTLRGIESRLARRQRPLAVWSLLVLGSLAVADALATLL